jgi:hypothetical protein
MDAVEIKGVALIMSRFVERFYQVGRYESLLGT